MQKQDQMCKLIWLRRRRRGHRRVWRSLYEASWEDGHIACSKTDHQDDPRSSSMDNRRLWTRQSVGQGKVRKCVSGKREEKQVHCRSKNAEQEVAGPEQGRASAKMRDWDSKLPRSSEHFKDVRVFLGLEENLLDSWVCLRGWALQGSLGLALLKIRWTLSCKLYSLDGKCACLSAWEKRDS